MKYLFYLIPFLLLSSCTTNKQIGQSYYKSNARYRSAAPHKSEEPITESLFNDKTASISEENIQKILDGSYSLPQNIRTAIVKLKSTQNKRNYYWNDEHYLKSQQEYLDLFNSKLKQSERVTKVYKIPDLLIPRNPTFTDIREAAVRTQSDMVVIYFINSDLYLKYKMFSKNEIKAFATIQLVIMDVRTGLIPFSTVVTREYQSKRQKNEFNDSEAANRIKKEAVLLTIKEVGKKINEFLSNE